MKLTEFVSFYPFSKRKVTKTLAKSRLSARDRFRCETRQDANNKKHRAWILCKLCRDLPKTSRSERFSTFRQSINSCTSYCIIRCEISSPPIRKSTYHVSEMIMPNSRPPMLTINAIIHLRVNTNLNSMWFFFRLVRWIVLFLYWASRTDFL